MSDEGNADFKLCRICTNSQTTSMVSLFVQYKNEDTLWKLIKSFAEVEIIQGDHLPQQVCLACADTIFNISVFKKKCEAADAFFRLELLKGLDYHYKQKAFEGPPLQEINDDDDDDEEDDDDDDDDSSSSSEDEAEENLPLIPEIELVTLNEDEQDEEDEHPDVPFTENQVDGHVVSYQCSTCKKTYLNRRFMEKHVRRDRCMQKRKNQTRPMQCSNCQIIFPSGHHYGWHKRNGCPSTHSNSPFNIPIQQAHSSYLQPMTTQNPMINSEQKTKGRNRIKLDAALLNSAKNLVQQGATTSQLAEHLHISRTFAWRLRKNMLNGETSMLPEQQPILIEDDELSPQPGCSNSSEKRKIRKFVKREKQKIRKPNVFINDEMYERAKEYIDQNMSTLEIARHLNISQMTAWKLRDAITKGIKLTFREKQPKKLQPNSSPITRESRVSLKKKIKAQERLERDKQISEEILNIVKDDISIQYWKISQKLSQKGYALSTSSVCQKLKAMGIRRRFKCHEKQRQQEGTQDDDNFINDYDEEANDQASDDSHNLVLNGGHFMSLGL